MKMYIVNDRVKLAERGYATYPAFGEFQKGFTKGILDPGGNCKGWIDKQQPPWFPYGKEATVISVNGDYCVVQTDDKKIWPNPVPFWCLSKV